MSTRGHTGHAVHRLVHDVVWGVIPCGWGVVAVPYPAVNDAVPHSAAALAATSGQFLASPSGASAPRASRWPRASQRLTGVRLPGAPCRPTCTRPPATWPRTTARSRSSTTARRSSRPRHARSDVRAWASVDCARVWWILHASSRLGWPPSRQTQHRQDAPCANRFFLLLTGSAASCLSSRTKWSRARRDMPWYSALLACVIGLHPLWSGVLLL